MRVSEIPEAVRNRLIDEIGDVFWYFWLIIELLDVRLEDVLKRNVQKLRQRQPTLKWPFSEIYDE